MKKLIIFAIILLVALVQVYWIVFRWPTKQPINEGGQSITRFSISESSYNDMADGGGRENYCFSLDENSLEIETPELGEKITIELDESERENLEQELLELIESYSLQKWDGYDEWMDVLDDFHSFTLSVEYDDGKEISAHGDHMFPDDYREVFKEVQSVFATYEKKAAKIKDNSNVDDDSNTEDGTDVEDSAAEDEKYLKILCETLGADYLEGRSTMRSMDDDGGEYIDGVYCAVYAIGTNKPEQFVVEEWFAVSSQADATVYEYDVVMDTWSVYSSVNKDYAQADDVDVDNCIYMLNEYLRDEFATEYYDAPEDVKRAIFNEESCTDAHIPDQLIGILEEIPEGYYADPLARDYYPVYNFDSFDSVLAHFSNYFTANAMVEIKNYLSYEFLDMDGTLYLVRGGRGYGAVSLDFGTIDKSQFASDGIVMVDTLLFGEKDGVHKVQFVREDGVFKIDSFG